MLITSRNWSAWTAGSLKYLIKVSSWAVGREAGSLLRLVINWPREGGGKRNALNI